LLVEVPQPHTERLFVVNKEVIMALDSITKNMRYLDALSKRVLILDTSVLCCWLQVPGKDKAGPKNDCWDHDRIDNLLAQERAKKVLRLPNIATLIETGNHIAQASSLRFERASALAKLPARGRRFPITLGGLH